MTEFCNLIKQALDSNPGFTETYSGIVRVVFPVIAILILSSAVISLFKIPKRPEAYPIRFVRKYVHFWIPWTSTVR